MSKPRFNDRYIREGFPPGWHVQDRLDDNTALLCRDDGAFLGFPANRCICVRPQAISTDEWLPTARQIAARLCANAQSRVDQESPDPLALAELFHDTYERLAPQYGYQTRLETRKFVPDAPNGKLMVATCAEILAAMKGGGR